MKRRGNDHVFSTWTKGGMFVKFLLPSFTVIFTKRKYFSGSRWACSKLFEYAHFKRFEMFDGVLNTPLQDQPPQILGNCSEIKSPGIFQFFAYALDICDLTVLQVYSICVRNKKCHTFKDAVWGTSTWSSFWMNIFGFGTHIFHGWGGVPVSALSITWFV